MLFCLFPCFQLLELSVVPKYVCLQHQGLESYSIICVCMSHVLPTAFGGQRTAAVSPEGVFFHTTFEKFSSSQISCGSAQNHKSEKTKYPNQSRKNLRNFKSIKSEKTGVGDMLMVIFFSGNKVVTMPPFYMALKFHNFFILISQ